METRTHRFTASIKKITNGSDVQVVLVIEGEDAATLAVLSDFKRQGIIEFVAVPLQLTLSDA